MALIRYGGAYGMPCSTTVLPTHLMPVVAITRWPWMVIASAPPRHSSLATAWMSCWWTTSRSWSTPSPVTDSGASSRVTVTDGPVTGVSPTWTDFSASSAARSVPPASLCAAASVSTSDAQPGDLGRQGRVAAGLGLHQADQIGVPARPQVDATRVGGADHHQQTGDHQDRRRRQPTRPGALAVATSLRRSGADQGRDGCDATRDWTGCRDAFMPSLRLLSCVRCRARSSGSPHARPSELR